MLEHELELQIGERFSDGDAYRRASQALEAKDVLRAVEALLRLETLTDWRPDDLVIFSHVLMQQDGTDWSPWKQHFTPL